jgi:hypothetical protein
MSRARRVEGLLFACAFVAFAWFHQGGGWNQNARFALVRAIAERGTFFIDSYLVYLPGGPDGHRFTRADVQRGEFRVQGRPFALGWRDANGALTPIAGPVADSVRVMDVTRVAMSGDLAFHGGRFHPNKAPGTSFLAVPAYFVIYRIERMLGVDPDAWFVLTLNAWLTSVLSIGLISALGVVAFYRFARRLAGDDRIAVPVALTFAFGTMYFPYATMLYEHNVIAVLLLVAWSLLHGVRADDGNRRRPLVLAGLAAGFAAITNYIAVVPLVILAVYVFDRRWVARAGWFGVGVLAPFLLICAYNVACFGTPFTTNYRYENPQFLEASGALLGVLGTPDLAVLVKLLASPFRGVFVTSPVLIVGVAGLVALWRIEGLRRDAALCSAMVAFFLLLNASFNGWHGGFAAAPRYLAPMLPFLVMPLVFAVARYRRSTIGLGSVSVAAMLVITAVDAQPPLGLSAIANVPDKAQWTYSPLTDYELPMLVHGVATPLLAAQRAARPTAPANAFPLATITGPVSVNPVGVYESDYYQQFKPGSPEAAINSFNAGELLIAGGVWSLLPMMLVVGALAAMAIVESRRPDPMRARVEG